MSSQTTNSDSVKTTNVQQIDVTKLTTEEVHKLAAEKANQKLSPQNGTSSRDSDSRFADKYVREDGTEDLALILAEEKAAEQNLTEMLKKYNGSYDHLDVFKAAIRMLESWIGLYKLQPMEELIAKVLPLARAHKEKQDELLKLEDAKANAKKDKDSTATKKDKSTTKQPEKDNNDNDDDDGKLTGLIPDDDDDYRPMTLAEQDAADDEQRAFSLLLTHKEYNEAWLRILQLKAFMRYKQHDYENSLELFEQFRQHTGDSPELLENMGHTYNVIGNTVKAIECFQTAVSMREKEMITKKNQIDSLLLIEKARRKDELAKMSVKEREAFDRECDEAEHKAMESITMSMGGLLLGLATSYKSKDQLIEALTFFLQALDLYKKRFNGKDHSLIAKTLTGLADCYTKLCMFQEALQSHIEAVRIFKVTCGVSPLTANALFGLAEHFEFLSSYVRVDEVTREQIEDKFNQLKKQYEQQKKLTQGIKPTPEEEDKLKKEQEEQEKTRAQKRAALEASTEEEKKLRELEVMYKEYIYQVHCAQALDESFKLHCEFDTPDLNQLTRVAQSVLDNKTKCLNKPFPTPKSPQLTLQAAFAEYPASIRKLIGTIAKLKLEQTDEAAVLNKSFGEMMLLAGHIEEGIVLIRRAKAHFEKVTSIDCSKLIKTCEDLIGAGMTLLQKELEKKDEAATKA